MGTSQEKKTDVAIIGAGIAGLTLAKFLAESGVDFILFEEDETLGNKACGEAVIPSIGDYSFKELYGSNRGVERLTEGFIIRTKYGDIREPLQDYVVDKKIVENELLKQASKHSCNIRFGQRVVNITKEHNGLMLYPQNIEAKVVVGCDGVNSKVRQFMGIQRPKCGVAASGILKSKPTDDLVLVFDKKLAPHGYMWFFPKANSWNIGIGNAHSQYFKDSFFRFKGFFPAVEKWNSALIPMSKPLRSYSDNTMLVGDSASQIVSFLGEGNLPAMICAKIASEVLIKESARGFDKPDLVDYERKWKAELGELFSTSYVLNNFFYGMSFLPDYMNHAILKLLSKTHINI